MWFSIGLLVGAAVIALIVMLRRKNFNLSWYEWIIGGIGLILLLFTIQNYIGSINEVEPKAANMFLLVTGLPSLVLLAITWQLAARRYKSS